VTYAVFDGSRTLVVRVEVASGASGDAVAIHLDSATLFRAPTLSIVGDASAIRIYDAPLDLARR
jgi:hypothetical protein